MTSAVPPTADRRVDLLGLSRQALAEALAPVIDRPYRVEQLYRALYRTGTFEFSAMTSLSRSLRAALGRSFRIGLPVPEARQASEDGTVKHLFRLRDGARIEAVDIPDGSRRTLCLSSQAGCALACRFCVTGYWGAGRNLTAGEILGQVIGLLGAYPPPPRVNLVLMGMGEPLHNLESVHAALAILSEAVSWRRITLSTVGIVPGIRAMARWSRRPNLAVSLHAPDDARRSAIMPVNRVHPLGELMEALAEYPLERRRRITIEYLLIQAFNDAPEDADALAARLRGLSVKINLIPVNPDPVLDASLVPPKPERVEAFRDRLCRHGLTATVRRRRGSDVSAACGQLRATGRRARGFRARDETELRRLATPE